MCVSLVEIIYAVGRNRKKKTNPLSHICIGTVLKSLYGLTLLILITTLWDKHYYYPHFTDGKAEVWKGELPKIKLVVWVELGFEQGKVSPESLLLTTDPYRLTFPKMSIKYLIFLTHGKYSINDNCFCCWIYSYYNYFSLSWLTHHLHWTSHVDRDWRSERCNGQSWKFLFFMGFSSTLAGGGSLLPQRSSKLSTSHPSLVARLQ